MPSFHFYFFLKFVLFAFSASGFTRNPDTNACTDINECESNNSSSPRCDTATQYCVNHPGSFTCSPCDAACKGCTNAGASACVECANGYLHKDPADDKSECVDDNECVMFPCQGAMDCKNTPGSYSCVCTSPNLMVSDVECAVCVCV